MKIKRLAKEKDMEGTGKSGTCSSHRLTVSKQLQCFSPKAMHRVTINIAF